MPAMGVTLWKRQVCVIVCMLIIWTAVGTLIMPNLASVDTTCTLKLHAQVKCTYIISQA